MASRIHEILSEFQQRKFMVVGDLLLDHYAFGSVNRISPEAPIQVLDIEKEEYRLGGAANVANNLAALGATTKMVGVVGKDGNSGILRAALRENGICDKGIFCDPKRPTTVKTRLISQGTHLLRTDREEKFPVFDEIREKIVNFVADNIDSCHALVLSDYAKGVLSEELAKELVSLANKNNKQVFVGPKGKAWGHYRGATMLSANRVETEMVSGMSIKTVDDAKKAAQMLRSELQLEAIAVTLGGKGLYVSCGVHGDFHIPAEAREVFDVAGAGDTVLSLFSLTCASGYPWKTAARLGNAAAGIAVGKVGASTVSAQELEAKLSQGHISRVEKIQKLRELMLKLEFERQVGRAIVFTNGCFDLLHPGHIRYLEYCKSRGDILVVALNSDVSVEALKGDKRPIMRENDRAEMLAALSCIDYVVIFSSSTPLKLIAQIKPDVLVKGSDWRQKGVVGRELVESYGGRVELYEVEQGYSSSKIIEKILR